LHLCKFFLHIATQRRQQLSKCVEVVPKRLVNEQVCAHRKSYRKQIFLNIFGAILCTYIAVFLRGVRWRHSKPPNSGPHFLVNFYPRYVVSGVFASATWLAGWVSVCHVRYCIKTNKPILKLSTVW